MTGDAACRAASSFGVFELLTGEQLSMMRSLVTTPSSGSIADCTTLWRAAYLHRLQKLQTALLLPDLPACLQMI